MLASLRLQGLLRRMNLPPQGRPRPLASSFLTCASGAIPFRTCAVAESTGIHRHKGSRPFRPPLRDCACEMPFHERGLAKPDPFTSGCVIGLPEMYSAWLPYRSCRDHGGFGSSPLGRRTPYPWQWPYRSRRNFQCSIAAEYKWGRSNGGTAKGQPKRGFLDPSSRFPAR